MSRLGSIAGWRTGKAHTDRNQLMDTTQSVTLKDCKLKELSDGCEMEELFTGVMKTLYNRRDLDGTDPLGANAHGSSRDYLQDPAGGTYTTAKDLVSYCKASARVPTKLFKRLDLLLTRAKQIKSLYNDRPQFKSLS